MTLEVTTLSGHLDTKAMILLTGIDPAHYTESQHWKAVLDGTYGPSVTLKGARASTLSFR